MLLAQTGKCEKCGTEFGSMETIQSTKVKCNSCNKENVYCEKCKEKGCGCGGQLLNAFDEFPGLLH